MGAGLNGWSALLLLLLLRCSGVLTTPVPSFWLCEQAHLPALLLCCAPPAPADLYMAVLLQQVVPAQYAFVLHTADPLTGMKRRRRRCSCCGRSTQNST